MNLITAPNYQDPIEILVSEFDSSLRHDMVIWFDNQNPAKSNGIPEVDLLSYFWSFGGPYVIKDQWYIRPGRISSILLEVVKDFELGNLPEHNPIRGLRDWASKYDLDVFFRDTSVNTRCKLTERFYQMA